MKRQRLKLVRPLMISDPDPEVTFLNDSTFVNESNFGNSTKIRSESLIWFSSVLAATIIQVSSYS